MLVIQHLKEHMSSAASTLIIRSKLVKLSFMLALMALSLEQRGYSILIVVCMPLVPHSFILFQSSTLAENPSFILLTEGKVRWVNYLAVIPSM
jgi:hypothetical protein